VLDDIAQEALKPGGELYVITRSTMPSKGPIAAIYRF